ncbi:TIGR00730 family Rossman fold protein [Reichenbachiella agarivorans]|uniref:Cytokinin riboside 5'-monophosphate phosphoribohydrolase n=1 Tax=Reichenbachiella agarivorans TaxID=2979464 RepID=A0ABY6CRM6_9BACT|nr:TIGR00730 family Rossman fold protein [Reichenbachiella agarivorans]UXP33171.1 TIGR00730 family Rossman fold protein [Reichenbachiella agarivorans]
MKSICVYCGSSMGNNPLFLSAAQLLGRQLAEGDIALVYGGATLGLMGAVANACLDAGGQVLGVIPRFLDEVEITHRGLTEIVITESMHERKTIMADRADGFIALPGGFGTLEELMEILTWSQLGLLQKPIGILNVAGYYDALIALFAQMKKEGLIKEVNMNLFVVKDNVQDLLLALSDFQSQITNHRQKLGLT